MKRYFITSDTHSFYDELMKSLNESGFDINNPEHIFVLCGDLFDRGTGSLELYDFIRNKLPKERRILIRGNHEYLLKDLLKKSFPESYDFSNGTVRTCCSFTNGNESAMRYLIDIKRNDKEISPFDEWARIKRSKKLKNIVKWIFESDEWLDYCELGKYILVHSFIPTMVKDIPETKWCKNFPTYNVNAKYLEPLPNWRDANELEWQDASWGCPWEQFREGLFNDEAKNGKVLVCGHWHASDFHDVFERELPTYKENDFTMYKGNNLIALDACTVLSHFCNVLVIDEDNLN